MLETDDGIGLCNYIDDYRDDIDPWPPSVPFSEIDLIVSDIRMPYITGMQVLRELRERDDAPPMILITAFGSDALHAKAERLGAVAVFDKPFDVEDLVAKVESLLPVH